MIPLDRYVISLHRKILEAGRQAVLPSYLTYPFYFLASSMSLTSVFRITVGQPGPIQMLLKFRSQLGERRSEEFIPEKGRCQPQRPTHGREFLLKTWFPSKKLFNSPKLQKVKCLYLVLLSWFLMVSNQPHPYFPFHTGGCALLLELGHGDCAGGGWLVAVLKRHTSKPLKEGILNVNWENAGNNLELAFFLWPLT